MQVFIERDNKQLTVDFDGNVKSLLQHLKINPEVALVTKNSELLTESDQVKNQDQIKILSVISGG